MIDSVFFCFFGCFQSDAIPVVLPCLVLISAIPPQSADAKRPGMHSNAKRWNEEKRWNEADKGMAKIGTKHAAKHRTPRRGGIRRYRD